MLYLVLRPWSYRRSWGRALLALVLCIPPLLLAIVTIVHAGGIMALHAFWLMAVFAILCACFIVSSIAAWVHRKRRIATAVSGSR